MTDETRPAKSLLVALIALVVIASPAFAGRGDCTTAQIDRSIVLPDGTQYPPGTLTICTTREFSPVASLHKTLVQGQAVGLLMSRAHTAESAGKSEPFMMFYRQADGSLLLYGYALPEGRNTTRSYRLVDPRRFRATTEADLAGASMVTLAARVF